MEPRKDGVRIDVLVQVGQKVAKDETLIARPVSGHPEPAVALRTQALMRPNEQT